MGLAVPALKSISLRTFAEKVAETVDRDCKKLSKFYAKGKMDRVHRTFVHSLRMVESAKRVIELLRETAGKGTDVNCRVFAGDAFVGAIKFNEIDAAARLKKRENGGCRWPECRFMDFVFETRSKAVVLTTVVMIVNCTGSAELI